MSETMRQFMKDLYGTHAPKEEGARDALAAVRANIAAVRETVKDYVHLVPAAPADAPDLARAMDKSRVAIDDAVAALEEALGHLDLTFRDTLSGLDEWVDTASMAIMHKAPQTAPASVQRRHRLQKETEAAIVLTNPDENPTGAIAMRRAPVLFS